MSSDWEIIAGLLERFIPYRKQDRRKAAELIRRQAPLLDPNFGERSGPSGVFLSWQLHNVGVGYAKNVVFRISTRPEPVFTVARINPGDRPQVEVPKPSGPKAVGRLEYQDSFDLNYWQEVRLKPGPQGYSCSSGGSVNRPLSGQLPWKEIKRILAGD